MFRASSALALALALGACATPLEVTPPPPAPPPPMKSMPQPGSYRIDTENSELRVLVYRAGPLANFGHNHVLINRELSGNVQVAAALEATTFTLSVPVARFTVDNAQARLQEGEEFPGEVPDSAREGTLHNMLSPMLLNGDSHPELQIRGAQVEETNGQLNAIMVLEIAGHAANIEAPFVLAPAPSGFNVTAEFVVRQSELGLTPMSLMGGALQVRDAIRIKLTLRALPP